MSEQNRPSDAAATAKVQAAYAVTHWWLEHDPEYVRLNAAAKVEGVTNPRVWVDRNRFALYVEANTPFPSGRLL